MTRPTTLLCIAVFAFMRFPASAGEPKQRADWGAFFESKNAEGTIVVVDQRKEGAGVMVFNETRAKTRFSPASTFKIPHALFALDAGLVTDEFQTFAWDGKKRWLDAWNQDHDLRSSMRHSVLWVYEGFASKIGEEGERSYLKKINYGNCDPTGTAPFWVEGNLRVTAHEQIEFLRRLYQNTLPFRVEHQRLVKDIIIVEAARDWRLRAKTGWSGTVGWWVGWVEWPTGPVFFALNIDTPNRMDDLPKREAVTRAILQSIGALPKKEGAPRNGQKIDIPSVSPTSVRSHRREAVDVGCRWPQIHRLTSVGYVETANAASLGESVMSNLAVHAIYLPPIP